MHLVSLNIEGHKHLDTVLPFLKREQPEATFLQEVFRSDLPAFATALGYTHTRFVPLCAIASDNAAHHAPLGQIGMALFAHFAPTDINVHYYSGHPAHLPVFTTNPSVISRAVISATFAGPTFQGTLACTHFTWSDHGQTTPQQLVDLDKLLSYLSTLPPHILIGDLNAPRGKHIWTKLASIYRDHIPPHLTSTLDPTIHRTKGTIAWVIDSLFSHSRYQVDHVQIIPGLSDHCAIVADIA